MTAFPETPDPVADPHPARGSVGARAFSFWLDSFLLSMATMAVMWALPVTGLGHELWFMSILGVYRVIGEFFYGRTPAKKLMNLRVRYTDSTGRERRGADRLVFVIARNSWLLVGGPVWFWAPEADLGGLIFVLFISLLFTSFRATVMDLLARARVVDTAFEHPKFG